jgi:hypothetical protein
MAVTASHRRQSADSGSVFGSKCDDNVGRFGFVRLQAIPIGVAPVGNVHHLGLCTRARGLGRLHDVESVAVEEERVLPEQTVQLRNHWMVVRNGLALELAQSPVRTLISSHTPIDRRSGLCSTQPNALEFPDGQIVLVTRLCEGQRGENGMVGKNAPS